MKINHRRKNKKPINERCKRHEFNNGFGNYIKDDETGEKSMNSEYLDKSMHGWKRVSTFSDKSFSAFIGNDFSNGNRGMAKSVRGAKKFVRTRIRFHEKAKLDKIVATEEF